MEMQLGLGQVSGESRELASHSPHHTVVTPVGISLGAIFPTEEALNATDPGDRRGVFTHGLRRASNPPIFSATVPLACSREFNSVANCFADPRRNAGADPAAGGFNSATDAGSNTAADAGANPTTDAASCDGGIGQDHEFRV